VADAVNTGVAANYPLVVDMDGALLRTDTTFEGLARALFAKPFTTMLACVSILRGRAAFKRAIASIVQIDVESLPLREDFVVHLKQERARGRHLHLVSGSDHQVVERVAARLGLFESAQGSSSGRNLKGGNKARFLVERFGQFAYAGDSPADLKVWSYAQSAVLAGASPDTARRARKLAIPIEREFLDPPGTTKHWIKTLRLHQWAKNILVFVPLLLSGHFTDVDLVLRCVLGFIILGLTASGTYIVNDLADLASDRRHRSKKHRPFAAGALKVYQGLIVAPVLIGGGLFAAFLLSPAFAAALLGYLVCTLAYSLRLKAIPFLDVMLLAWLYTLRLLMGVALAQSTSSVWLLTFSMMFFFSMSLAKRHVEVAAASPDQDEIAGRGYLPKDAPVTLAFGISSSVASLLIMTLYLMEEAFPSNVYGQPALLWLVLPIVGLWTMRIWLLAHRGELDDDPVAFAVKDKVSIALGGALALAFAVAVFG
jgi:4-hydroxybenzoate polyprenyltransferase/phosphoserine phosphatase